MKRFRSIAFFSHSERRRSIAFFSHSERRRGTALISHSWRGYRLLAALPAICGACVVVSKQIDPTSDLAQARVRPGISVLLSDSLDLIRGKRIALLTNQTGVNEGGTSDIDLLREKRARAANVNLVQLFSPEHGLRGTEDRQNIANTIDQKSGLPVFSLLLLRSHIHYEVRKSVTWKGREYAVKQPVEGGA